MGLDMTKLTPEMQQMLQDYKKSLEEELSLDLDRSIPEATRKELETAANQAVTVVVQTMTLGETQALRYRAATYVLDKVIGVNPVIGKDDPLKELVDKLQAGAEKASDAA